jgi:hypothetical protein
MKKFIRIISSKTVLGGVAATAGWLASLPVIDIKHVLMGAGTLLAIIGGRDALHEVTDAVKENTDVSR